MRGASAAAAAVVAAFASAVPAGAGLTVQVRHEAGGLHRAGLVVPVRVSLRNDGTTDARAEIRGGEAGEPSDSVRDVVLGPGARKEISLPIAGGFGREYRVEVRGSERGAQLVRSEPVSHGEWIVGVIGRCGFGLAGVASAPDPPFRLARLREDALPSHLSGFMSLDALVWPDPDPAVLDAETVAAIGSWVQGGGVLVVGVARRVPESAAGRYASLTGARVAGLRTALALPGLAAAAGAGVQATSGGFSYAALAPGDGSVLAEERGEPVVVEAVEGAGRVVTVGYDLAGDAAVPGAPFWTRLLRIEPIRAPEETWIRFAHSGLHRSLILRAMDPGEVRPPALGILVAVMGLYLLLIGPVDYLVLRRLRRFPWTWITYPSMILICAAGLYFTGRHLRSGASVLRSVHLVDGAPGAPHARETISASIFSQAPGVYHLSAPAGSALVPVSDDRDPFGVGVTRAGACTAGPDPGAKVRMQPWSFASFLVFRETAAPAVEGALEGTARAGEVAGAGAPPPWVRGLLTWRGPRALRDALLVADGHAFPLPAELAPGSPTVVEAEGTSLPQWSEAVDGGYSDRRDDGERRRRFRGILVAETVTSDRCRRNPESESCEDPPLDLWLDLSRQPADTVFLVGWSDAEPLALVTPPGADARAEVWTRLVIPRKELFPDP